MRPGDYGPTVITMTFYDSKTEAFHCSPTCPPGSPVPRVGETVELQDGLLYDVVRVRYRFQADGAPPDVIVALDDF